LTTAPDRATALTRLGAGLVAIAAGVAVAVTLVAGALVSAVDDLDLGYGEVPDLADAALRPASEASVVVAADGSTIGRFRPDEVHIPLDHADLPESVKATVVAAEDQSFWEHPGFDVRGTVRAAMANVASGEVVQGGSTITQRLAKNLFTSGEQSIDRKVDEIVAARQLEAENDKEDILTAYLNTVFFGEAAFGIEAAARTYFRTSASDLSLSEAALLAGVIPAPSA
jgi:penicillin-binding protein 1A